jgi:hypothetical protein
VEVAFGVTYGQAVHRSYPVSILIAFVLATGLALVSCSQRPTPTPKPLPRLIMDDSVADDLKEVAEETWNKFLAVFRARADCFGDVHLRAAYDLDNRAAYDPTTATVTVQVPATSVMLQGALIHEWAHHIEFQCDTQKEMRPAFLAAQGLPADTVWRPDDDPANTPESAWAGIPSEQYAEATIELVLGSRQIPTTARVSVEAVQVIAAWASGK